MSTVEVRAASEREQQAVIDVITLAFSLDPMARWAYPNPQTYLAIGPRPSRRLAATVSRTATSISWTVVVRRH
jgi:hypothetical protein